MYDNMLVLAMPGYQLTKMANSLGVLSPGEIVEPQPQHHALEGHNSAEVAAAQVQSAKVHH